MFYKGWRKKVRNACPTESGMVVLIVISGTFLLYGAAIPLFSWWFHRTMAEVASPALGILGLLGLTGLETLFYHAPRSRTPVNGPVMDERDWLLLNRAWIAGMRISGSRFVSPE